MKRFFLKSFLFCSPFILAISLELFILPIDFFTFRAWEALLIKEFRLILPGRFYPDREIIKLEMGGDLSHHTPYATPRRVRWVTDRYGFRKQESKGNPQVVIIGDSNIAGMSLTQEEMLSEVLEDKLKIPVYPYAPVGFNTFLKDMRFKEYPPSIVILSVVERDLMDLPFPKQSQRMEKAVPLLKLEQNIKQTRWIQSVCVWLDRLSKMNMLNYFRARIGNRVPRDYRLFQTKYGPMFFLQGENANREVPKDHLEKAIKTIEAYDQILKGKGIRFIFVPIPNKENIYYEYLPNAKRPIFLEQLIQELKNKRIETVDTQKAFEDDYRKNSTLLYFLDDTHWNSKGVRLVADLTVQMIERRE